MVLSASLTIHALTQESFPEMHSNIRAMLANKTSNIMFDIDLLFLREGWIGVCDGDV